MRTSALIAVLTLACSRPNAQGGQLRKVERSAPEATGSYLPRQKSLVAELASIEGHKERSVAVDSTFVYFIGAGSALTSIPKQGGSTRVIYRGTDVHDLIADASGIFWLEFGRPRALREGILDSELTSSASSDNQDRQVFSGAAGDTDRVYFGVEVYRPSGCMGHVRGVAKARVSSLPQFDVVTQCGVRVLAAGPTSVYFTLNGQELWAIRKLDQHAILLHRGHSIRCAAPATDGGVYYADAGDGTVYAIPEDSPITSVAILTGLQEPTSIVLDANRLYVGTKTGVISIVIGAAEQRSIAVDGVLGLAQDAGAIYILGARSVASITKQAIADLAPSPLAISPLGSSQ